MSNNNRLVFGIIVCCLVMGLRPGRGADPFEGAPPLWSLVHEPAVVAELGLSREKLGRFRSLVDSFDTRFFPLRNHAVETVAGEVTEVLGELTAELQGLLSKAEYGRLLQIQLRVQGSPALLQPDVAGLMKYSPEQRQELERVISGGLEGTAALRERLAKGEPRGPLEAEYIRLKEVEGKTLQSLLEPRQVAIWNKLLGPDFALDRLGHPTYRAPEFFDSGQWINSEPVRLEDLSGKVVVLHFYACGCINCIHNYPVYLDWSRRFRGQDVAIIGIHTPETAVEANAEHVRERAAEAGFDFPVLIDPDKANWNAWGNSMWPSVYLIDKWGRLRFFWPGELRWEAATGDEWMAARIEELLAERTSPTPGD
jgi:peroxiredoxin